MDVLILNGSPRRKGNTSALIDVISNKLQSRGDVVKSLNLYDLDIKGCSNCGACQNGEVRGHCTIDDDMSEVYDQFLVADLAIIASPIYMWQLTPCSLAFLNRLHALQSEGRNEMKGKKMALAVTLGDASECADGAISGMMDFCEYFQLDYRGMVRIPYADRNEILEGLHDVRITTFVYRL